MLKKIGKSVIMLVTILTAIFIGCGKSKKELKKDDQVLTYTFKLRKDAKWSNDYDNSQKINSTDRTYINNFRRHAILEICKNLVNKAIYYRCDIFGIEELNFKSTDRGNKRFNRLCNNQWNRTLLVQNIQKRCNIYNIKFITVKPEYSSFVGNLLFRHTTKAPDMVLSSIEIGRRAYEFKSQYIDKTKNKSKKVVFPDVNDFVDLYTKSLEEFNIYEKSFNWTKLYSYFKNTK